MNMNMDFLLVFVFFDRYVDIVLLEESADFLCAVLTETIWDHSCNILAFDFHHRFVDHYCSYGFGQFVFDRQSSNEVLDRRDSRIAAEMERYYAYTKRLIVENRSKLDKLIERLVEEKTLLGEQVQEIIRCA
jgi:hypothetical protein